MDSDILITPHELWPEGEHSAQADLQHLSGGSNLLYLLSGDSPYSQQVITNITSLIGITWRNTHCLDLFDSSRFPSSGRSEQHQLLKRISAIGKHHDSKKLIIIDHLDRFDEASIGELDFSFRLTDATTRRALLSSSIVLFVARSPTPELASVMDRDGNRRVDLAEMTSFLSSRLQSTSRQFNGEAFMGRISRFAVASTSREEGEHEDSLCAYVRERKLREGLPMRSQQQTMDFSSFLALLSIPIIAYYLWKIMRPKQRMEEVDEGIPPPAVPAAVSARTAHTQSLPSTTSIPSTLVASDATSPVHLTSDSPLLNTAHSTAHSTLSTDSTRSNGQSRLCQDNTPATPEATASSQHTEAAVHTTATVVDSDEEVVVEERPRRSPRKPKPIHHEEEKEEEEAAGPKRRKKGKQRAKEEVVSEDESKHSMTTRRRAGKK